MHCLGRSNAFSPFFYGGMNMSTMVEQLEEANKTVETYKAESDQKIVIFEEEMHEKISELTASSTTETLEYEKRYNSLEEAKMKELKHAYEENVVEGKKKLHDGNKEIEERYFKEIMEEVVEQYGRM